LIYSIADPVTRKRPWSWLASIDWSTAWRHRRFITPTEPQRQHVRRVLGTCATGALGLLLQVQGVFLVRRLVHNMMLRSNAFLAPRREPSRPARHRGLSALLVAHLILPARRQAVLLPPHTLDQISLRHRLGLLKPHAFMYAVRIFVPSPGQTLPASGVGFLFRISVLCCR
jgi:hypothetical protein